MTDFRYVSGWGRTPIASTKLIRTSSESETRAAVVDKSAKARGLISRGLGRSYGDAAQRSGGVTLIINSKEDPEWLDLESGLVRCPASTPIGELVRFADRYGFFAPVTPGTRFVSIGGAVAADIHGKDHHRVGSFGSCVRSVRMMLADGETVLVDRSSDPELFDATLGGMGLTGIILDVDVEMVAVPGNKIEVETSRTQDLQETMEALVEAEATHRYSVGWIDLVAGGAQMGRGVVTSGNHSSARDESPLKEPHISVPKWWNLNLINHSTVRAFNEVWYHKAPSATRYATQSYDTFFYPLDMLGYWNRVYGKRGFLQYQFVIPLDSDEVLTRIVERISSTGVPVSLAVLKRLGPESTGYLSFPMPGWTLAMDIPIPTAPDELEKILRELDLLVVNAGGRIYLAKDSRLGPDLVATMYPDLGRFRAVRERVDPDHVFQSDLAERLGL